MDFTLGLLCGIGLAAACGFRVFVPLLGTSIAGLSGQVQLSPGFEWMATTPAVVTFGVATALEIGAYYIPWLDNLLDVITTPATLVAGTMLTASMVTDVSPFLKWTLAVIAGGGIAGTVQSGTALVRGVSTLGTAGAANPVLSTFEWIISAVMTLLSVLVPVLAIVVLALFFAAIIWVWRRGRSARLAATQRADAVHKRPTAKQPGCCAAAGLLNTTHYPLPTVIWDLHCHLSGVDGDTPDLRMDNLMRFADRMGIERVVIFMGFPWSNDPSPDELRAQNDQVLQALSHWHDRAFGFAYVNPHHVEASLAEIDRCVRDGPLIGIKLWVAMRCSDAALDPLITRCADLKAAIFQHTWHKVNGNLPGESTAEDMAVLAARHPATPLICGHAGGDWELGIRAIRAHPNVSIDLGGSDPTAGMVEMAVRELGAERIIYGSDAGGRSFASQLAKVRSADISDEARSLILSGNLRTMFLPSLQAKGVRI